MSQIYDYISGNMLAGCFVYSIYITKHPAIYIENNGMINLLSFKKFVRNFKSFLLTF